MINKKNQLNRNKIFGTELLLNLYECDLKVMKSKRKLLEFPVELCKIIKMNICGKAIIRRTGKEHLYGYSLIQFIETSSITIHTCDQIKETYLDIFSCKPYNAKVVIDFTKKFFKTEKIKKTVIFR